ERMIPVRAFSWYLPALESKWFSEMSGDIIKVFNWIRRYMSGDPQYGISSGHNARNTILKHIKEYGLTTTDVRKHIARSVGQYGLREEIYDLRRTYDLVDTEAISELGDIIAKIDENRYTPGQFRQYKPYPSDNLKSFTQTSECTNDTKVIHVPIFGNNALGFLFSCFRDDIHLTDAIFGRLFVSKLVNLAVENFTALNEGKSISKKYSLPNNQEFTLEIPEIGVMSASGIGEVYDTLETGGKYRANADIDPYIYRREDGSISNIRREEFITQYLFGIQEKFGNIESAKTWPYDVERDLCYFDDVHEIFQPLDMIASIHRDKEKGLMLGQAKLRMNLLAGDRNGGIGFNTDIIDSNYSLVTYDLIQMITGAMQKKLALNIFGIKLRKEFSDFDMSLLNLSDHFRSTRFGQAVDRISNNEVFSPLKSSDVDIWNDFFYYLPIKYLINGNFKTKIFFVFHFSLKTGSLSPKEFFRKMIRSAPSIEIARDIVDMSTAIFGGSGYASYFMEILKYLLSARKISEDSIKENGKLDPILSPDLSVNKDEFFPTRVQEGQNVVTIPPPCRKGFKRNTIAYWEIDGSKDCLFISYMPTRGKNSGQTKIDRQFGFTIPKEFRSRQGKEIHKGDRVIFSIDADNRIIFRKDLDYYASLKKITDVVTVQEKFNLQFPESIRKILNIKLGSTLYLKLKGDCLLVLIDVDKMSLQFNFIKNYGFVLSSKAEFVIPRAIRNLELVNIEVGDKLVFSINENEQIEIRKSQKLLVDTRITKVQKNYKIHIPNAMWKDSNINISSKNYLQDKGDCLFLSGEKFRDGTYEVVYLGSQGHFTIPKEYRKPKLAVDDKLKLSIHEGNEIKIEKIQTTTS
ncbi:MAG: hypothetical protein ACFFD4_40015, partial [Candidatus Odinarchaeota archaeon]